MRTVAELRAELAPARREGLTIGLVPTMGALHEGHLSLISPRPRRSAIVVVVSLFVNPAQFNERADLERYPRRRGRATRELAAAAGADVLFAPSIEEVYPPGFATSVEVLGVSERLEGRLAAPSTSAAWRPSSPSCSAWRCPTSPTSARRTPSRSSSSAVWSRT